MIGLSNYAMKLMIGIFLLRSCLNRLSTRSTPCYLTRTRPLLFIQQTLPPPMTLRLQQRTPRSQSRLQGYNLHWTRRWEQLPIWNRPHIHRRRGPRTQHLTNRKLLLRNKLTRDRTHHRMTMRFTNGLAHQNAMGATRSGKILLPAITANCHITSNV